MKLLLSSGLLGAFLAYISLFALNLIYGMFLSPCLGPGGDCFFSRPEPMILGVHTTYISLALLVIYILTLYRTLQKFIK